jgi:hypothetical protein
MISSSKHTPPAKPRNLPADRPTVTLPVSTICPSVIPVIVTRRHSVNRSSSVIPAQAGNQQTHSQSGIAATRSGRLTQSR